MKYTYFYSNKDYEGPLRPVRVLERELGLRELSCQENDPDYPINSRISVLLFDKATATRLHISVYPTRAWLPTYMRCKRIKAEMLVGIDNEDKRVVDKMKTSIDDIVSLVIN